VGEFCNWIPCTSRAQPTTWAIKLSRELAKGVIGAGKAFGTFILFLDQTSNPHFVDRFHPHYLTNVALSGSQDAITMTRQLASEALIPNPRLSAFKPFIGTWTTVGHHSMMPGITLHGRTTFECDST
jgi:hypothetical protein